MLKSIRSKLLVPILSIVLLAGIGMGVESYRTASEAINEANSRDGLVSVHGLSQLVDQVMDTARFDNTGVASNPLLKTVLLEPESSTSQLELLEMQMKELVERQPLYNSIIALNATGKIIASSSGSRGKERGDREYFKESMKGKFYISPPSTSKETKKTVIFFSVPVMDQSSGSPIGVVMTSLQVEPLSARYVQPVSLLEAGYAMIVNSKGKYIAHRNEEMIASEGVGADLLNILSAQPPQATMLVQKIGETSYVLFTETSKLTGWQTVIVCPQDVFYAQSHRMAVINASLAALLVIVIGLISFFAIRKVTNDLGTTIQFATSVAGGHLDAHLPLTRNDELGVLANALRAMVTSLKDMIGKAEIQTEEARKQTEVAARAQQEAEEARKMADQAKREGMHQAAVKLQSIAQTLTEATQSIARQVAEASHGASEQRKIAGQAAESTHQLEMTVEDVARSASDAADSSAQTKGKAEAGAHIVKGVITSITSLDEKTAHLQTSLSELGQRAEAIGQIMVVISDIADQTNLLALNAAIEAARAGDAGRGFAVVADEVRKLAEKTMQATKEVGDAVKAIQGATHQNITEMEDTSKAVAQSTAMAQDAGKALAEIVSISEVSANQVTHIASSSHQQRDASEQINHDTFAINSIAAKTADLMHEANDTVTNITRLTEAINALVRELEHA